MRFRMIMVAFTFVFVASGLLAQGISGSFKLTGVHVQYYDVARDSGAAAEDSLSTYTLALSWPSAAQPQFHLPVEHFEVGDTIAAPETPAFLTTPEGLAFAGIDLTLTFSEDGSFTIPTSTYPTTGTENCSTFAKIPTIQDAGTYEWDGNDNRGQFGINESNIFDLFSADSAKPNRGWLTVVRNATNQISHLVIEWEAIDGTDSNIGIDDAGNLNRQMGIAMLPADDGFVAYLKTLNPNLNVGTFPTVGENFPGDGEDLSANWMYVFDPAGPDGQVFNGDEPLQFTGYYFTYNFLIAVKTLAEAFAAYMAQNPTDTAGGVSAAVSAVLTTFQAPSAVISTVSAAAYTQVAALIAAGLSLEDALKGGMVWSVGATLHSPNATDLFFSEYVEGSSNNKALEIYNGTGAAVDLSNYQIAQAVNGGGWQYWHTFPTGASINSGDVWVITTDQADAAITAVADEVLAYPSVSHHNGDDARALVKISGTDTTWLDIIGDPDNDPGAGWAVAGASDGTKEHTLVRKSTVMSGSTDWTASAGTDSASSEWLVYGQDTFIHLGSHDAAGWVFPDDSDHDVVLTNIAAGGRLVFEMGNQCVPDNQTRIVIATLANVDPTIAVEEEEVLPTEFALRQNYPNPFNPTTTIAFDVPTGSDLSVTVWNLLGEKVRTVYSGYMGPGQYTVTFDGRDELGTPLSTGIYLYRLETQGYSSTKKMLLMK